jgi:NitT/TauT family transport system substrate-binding protein
LWPVEMIAVVMSVANRRKVLINSLTPICLIAWFGLASALAPEARAAETVILGLPSTASDVFFFLAKDKGYFEAEGIDVQFTHFPSAAQMIAPLGTGDLNVAAGTVSAGLYNAVERGIKMRIVADKGSVGPGFEWSTLLVRKDLVESGHYKTLADLKGMTVATAAKGAGSESSLNEALKKGGLKFTDVNVVYMGFPAMHAALANKGIDACVSAEPTQTQMLRAGLVVRATPDVVYPGQQAAVVLYSESFAQKKTALARKFMLAYLRATRFYNDALADGSLASPKASEIVSLLIKYTDIKDRTIYETMTPFAVDSDGKINLATLRNDLAFYKSRQLVGPNIAAEAVVDMSFAEDAAKELGPHKRTR